MEQSSAGRPRGFAGIGARAKSTALVPKVEAPAVVPKASSAAPPTESSLARDASRLKPPQKGIKADWWVGGAIALFVAYIFLKPSTPSAPEKTTQVAPRPASVEAPGKPTEPWARDWAASTKIESPPPAELPKKPAWQSAPAFPQEEIPPIGNGLVLTTGQIRFCVYEKARLETAERLANGIMLDSDDVDRLNRFIGEYNKRCGHFRYRKGALERVQAELPGVQPMLEAEARKRVFQ